jgi:transposase-like protein
MKRISVYYQTSAVQYYLKHKKDMRKTCKLFNCKTKSLAKWIKKYERNKTLKRKIHKITPSIEKSMIEYGKTI